MADRTEPEAANQVTVVATSLKLRNAWQIRRFFRLNGGVTRQLDSDPTGLIGYWLKADFLRLRFSTLSVWEDDAVLDEFVASGPHRAAMAGFDEISVRERSTSTRWHTDRHEDTTWEAAFARLRMTAVGADL